MLGPKVKINDVSEAEQIQIIEAYQEAQEYLDMGFIDDDIFIDTND